jgi:hypothetical protein
LPSRHLSQQRTGSLEKTVIFKVGSSPNPRVPKAFQGFSETLITVGVLDVVIFIDSLLS